MSDNIMQLHVYDDVYTIVHAIQQFSTCSSINEVVFTSIMTIR